MSYPRIFEGALRVVSYSVSYWIAGWPLVAAEILLEWAHNLDKHK